MASRYMYPVRSIDLESVTYDGHFFPQGTSAPTTDITNVGGYTVKRLGVGQYQVTTMGSLPVIADIQLGLQLNATAAVALQLGAVTPSTQSFIINAVNSNTAAPVELAASPNNVVHFSIFLQDMGKSISIY